MRSPLATARSNSTSLTLPEHEQVKSNPPGAQVFVGNADWPDTPSVVTFPSPGEYDVRVVLSHVGGAKALTVRVKIGFGPQTLMVDFSMDPPRAMVTE